MKKWKLWWSKQSLNLNRTEKNILNKTITPINFMQGRLVYEAPFLFSLQHPLTDRGLDRFLGAISRRPKGKRSK